MNRRRAVGQISRRVTRGLKQGRWDVDSDAGEFRNEAVLEAQEAALEAVIDIVVDVARSRGFRANRSVLQRLRGQINRAVAAAIE